MQIPEIKVYTQEELIKKVSFIKKMREWSSRRSRKNRKGKEMFFDTEAGRVRTLTYGFDNHATQALFVDIHGGGFIFGDPEMDDPYNQQLAEEAGIKIVSIDYSLAPEHPFPAAIDECYATVKYMQTHASELGIDAGRIAVGGHSAGGNFTAAICIRNAMTKELNIKAAILDYPPLDVYTDAYEKPRGKGFMARFMLPPKRSRIFDACYCTDREARRNPLISPLYASDDELAAFPPVLVITAGRDSLCAEGDRFAERLRSVGTRVLHRRFDKAQHGFTLFDSPDAREGRRLITEFLRKELT
ncbi:MAG: alpha/beta hydrolase [Tannerella sp.]|jgi:acetyl esterase|nr:alpha/beta hydrolase [Tannerella sp.]